MSRKFFGQFWVGRAPQSALLVLVVGLATAGCLRKKLYEDTATTHLDQHAPPPAKEQTRHRPPRETPIPGNPNPAPVQVDADFLRKAAHSLSFQVRLGQLMVRQGEDSALELFGQQLVIDYSQASEAAAELAEAKGLVVSDDLGEGTQYKLARLTRVYGQDFARAVLEESIRGHREAIFINAAVAARSQDPAMRELAQRTLPVLQQHLDEALRLASKY